MGLSRAVPSSHLAGGLGAAEDAEVDHEPGQRQAERLLPLHAAAGLQRRGDVQGLPVPEVLGGRRLLTLLLVAGAVAVQGAGSPWQGVLGGRDREEELLLSAHRENRGASGDEGERGFVPRACSCPRCVPWGWGWASLYETLRSLLPQPALTLFPRDNGQTLSLRTEPL